MIIWGGVDDHIPMKFNSGGRYYPSTDSWETTSIVPNTPGAVKEHTAIWTGNEMIVWGGGLPATYIGGRYNPSVDQWLQTSIGPGVPEPRFAHTAVWTGIKMIVWGGEQYEDGNFLNSGGIYDLGMTSPSISGSHSDCGSTLLSTDSFSSYQWNFNGSPILAATSQTYEATASGNYSITVTNSYGCEGTSSDYSVTISSCLSMTAEPLFTAGTSNLVSWNVAPKATAYEAEASSDNFGTIFASSGQITDTFFNFTGLTSGVDYEYRVRAVYPWGVSDWSPTVHSTQDAAPPSSIFLDPIVGGLLYGSIYAITGTASDPLSGVGLVELSWDGGANWYPATGTTSWTYNWVLPSDGNYTLFVRATDAVGNIETMHSIPVTVRNRPSPATNVNAVDVPFDGGGIIDITWILSADDGGGMNYISGYSIYRANSAAGPFQKIAWVLAGTSYAQDTNAGVGINRYYKVRAETDWDVTPNFTDSEIFGPIASTDDSPLPVNNLLADLTLGCNVRLVWIESPSPDILLYNIYCDNGTGTVNYSTPLGTVSAPATTWVSSGLALYTAYIFAVRAKDLSGKEDGLTANQVSITTECSSGIVRAEIKQPQAGRKIKGTKVTVLAQLIQGDASGTRDVLFQYRTTGGGTWTDMIPSGSGELNPDSSSPYTLHWNSTLLPDGDYDLRSVATNLADQQDGAPPYVTVTIDNVNGNLQEDSTDGNHQAVFETYRGSGNSNLTAMERDMTEVQLTIPKGSLPVSIGNTTLREEDPAIYGLKQAKGIFKGATGFFVLSETLNAAGVYRTIELPSGLTSFSTWADLVIFYRDDDNDGIVDGTTIPALQLDLFRLESGDDWSLQNSNRTVDTVNKFIRVTITQAGTFGLFSYPKPQAVNDLKVEPSGNDARIYWPAVTLDDKGNAITVDHYNIYIGATPDFSPDLINHANLLSGGAGQVVGLQTYDVGALTGTESRFYLATAVDGTGKESYPR